MTAFLLESDGGAVKNGYIVAVLVGALLGCDKPIATIPFKDVGATERAGLTLAPGAKVGFAVFAAKHSYSGKNNVMLDVELIKSGAIVERMTCEGFELEGMSGSGCSTTHYNSSCSMTSPASGSDAVRISTRMENEGSATFEGLEVRVLQ